MKKLQLNDLKVQSFITELSDQKQKTIHAGNDTNGGPGPTAAGPGCEQGDEDENIAPDNGGGGGGGKQRSGWFMCSVVACSLVCI